MLKAKYIKWHNNYDFILGETYEALHHSNEWIAINGQLYRAECFELSGLLKPLINYITEFVRLPSQFTSEDIGVVLNDLCELEAKAAKWDDPQTQADVELAAAVKLLFVTGQHHLIQTYKGCRQVYFYDEQMLIAWYREQKRGAE